ncbi:MAG TPA: acireductone synthase [Terracidiphilus sp.]|jgi:2,3-diketo-5-methylthio-1-phosphopentane phosphatase|nr:acireductone synthase [Terracidiphilus sp.]
MTATEPRVYLLDLEGTVAPISLVSEQLFPYARAHVAAFLKQNLGLPEVQNDLKLLAAENRAEQSEDSPTFGIEIRNELHARAYLLWLMDRDRKSTALKSLQGKIWKAGFEGGALKGTLFADVPEAFAHWASQGKVAIYSSGSVEAQQLLFRHSTYGDLTPLISSYFDTRTGAKLDSASYAAIAAELSVDSAEVIFFSDVVRELDAARAAGCSTRLVVREGNAPVEDAQGHEAVSVLI